MQFGCAQGYMIGWEVWVIVLASVISCVDGRCQTPDVRLDSQQIPLLVEAINNKVLSRGPEILL